MRSKTYQPQDREPDGRDDGSGGKVPADRLDDETGEPWEGVPYWYIDDPQGDLPDDDAP